MDDVGELQGLYAAVLAIAQQYIGTPPPHALFNPGGWLRQWVTDHPQQAQALAANVYQYLDNHFRARGR